MKKKMDIKPSTKRQQQQPQELPQTTNITVALHVGQLDSSKLEDQQQVAPSQQIVASGKRWIILLLFCLSTGNKAFQWIQVPASTLRATQFYGVPNYAINTLSMIFIWFTLLSVPACYVVDRLGLRRALLLGSFGAAFGSVLKCLSCRQDAFWLLVVSQILVSLSEQLILWLPTRLASVWFPDKQVSVATSLCMLGNQCGIALGFLAPPMFLGAANTSEQIGWGLQQMFLLTMIVSVALFILNWWLFDEAPQHAPGLARWLQIHSEQQQSIINKEHSHNAIDKLKSTTSPTGIATFLADMRSLGAKFSQLARDRHLMLLALSHGIRYGVADIISTLLDQMVTPLWPDTNQLVSAGNIGCIIVLSGALGLPLWGACLDKFRCFKWLNVALSLAAIILFATFAWALIWSHSPLLICLTSLLFGLFQTGSLVASTELAVELTYPQPEMVTASFINLSPPLTSTFTLYLSSHLADQSSEQPLAVELFLIGCLAFALILLVFTRETLRRQEAIEHGNQERPNE